MNDVSLNKKVPLWPLWVLFFTSTDTLLFGTNANEIFLYVPRIIGLCIFLFLPFFLHKTVMINRKTIIAFILVVIATFSAFVNKMEFPTIVSRIISILVAYSIAMYYEHKYYVAAFCKFIYFIATVAIITEAFAYIYPAIFNLFPTVTNTADYSFSAFFIGSMRYDFLSNQLIRAEGIFWEPGAFSIYVDIALMYELFFKETINTKRIIVYLVALVLTFSTTGYIGFFTMALVYILTKKTINNEQFINKFVLCFVMLILIVGVIGFENSSVYEMVFGKIENTESTAVTRYSSIVNGLEIALNNPLLGVGSNKIRESIIQYSSNSSFGRNPMLTNTCVMQFATFGMIFGIIYLVNTVKYFTKQNWNWLCKIGLLVTLMLLYCGETFYSFLPFIFVFYGSDNIKQEGADENCINQFTS